MKGPQTARTSVSGWAVLEALKEKLLLTQVPVIIVTGWADEGIRDRARQLGAVGALIKPFGVHEAAYSP